MESLEIQHPLEADLGSPLAGTHHFSPDVPPGEYQIEVGMYLAGTGERLPVMDPQIRQGADRILIGGIRVKS